jgi:hypothetical protein
MSPQASPTIQRAIRKLVKQAPTKPVVEQTADPQPAPLAASDNGDNLEARIRMRAYELYEQRGSYEGHELDDWLQAERQVLASRPVSSQ